MRTAIKPIVKKRHAPFQDLQGHAAGLPGRITRYSEGEPPTTPFHGCSVRSRTSRLTLGLSPYCGKVIRNRLLWNSFRL